MIQQRALSQPLTKRTDRQVPCGEPEFTIIFESYYQRIYNYIHYRVNCRYTAEDLTSQVFEKTITKIATFKVDHSPFEVWLFAIARNVVNDYFRSSRRHNLFFVDIIKARISSHKEPESQAVANESRDMLSKALEVLNPKERNLVALKFGASLKNKEIAELTGMSESNVGVSLFRSLKKLKQEIERMDEHE
ncbi:MAG: sigma-70 family RNA polymerase sigma factor [Gorillibacterium sp.]|nr:sigma-70 family RNA polymerase sigma factor [Gorillibacterium sp.]